MIKNKTAIAVAKAFALMLVAASAHANIITNSSFEQYTLGDTLHRMDNSNVPGWLTTSGTTWVVSPDNIQNLLWTTLNGGLKLLTPSPDGGKFLAMDSDYLRGPVYQTVSGLKAGDTYNLSFFSALAQQAGTPLGQTYDWMNVSLGDQQQLVWATPGNPTYLASQDFSGWQQFNLTFQATAASEILSFAAYGGPAGAPPYVLLDGVSLTPAVPEPEEWAMMLVGAGLVSWQVRRKQAQVAA
jgi:hypothetical protein